MIWHVLIPKRDLDWAIAALIPQIVFHTLKEPTNLIRWRRCLVELADIGRQAVPSPARVSQLFPCVHSYF